jgi:hypothetical protein
MGYKRCDEHRKDYEHALRNLQRDCDHVDGGIRVTSYYDETFLLPFVENNGMCACVRSGFSLTLSLFVVITRCLAVGFICLATTGYSLSGGHVWS